MTSTERKHKKKRAIARVERFKIIEYVCIGLVILLFLGLAIFYGSGATQRSADIPEPTVSPEPTEDPSIRGMHVFSALEDNGFSVEQDADAYLVTAPNGVVFRMQMQSDDKGIVDLTFETPFCPDPEEEGSIYDALRLENRRTTEALRDLFDQVMPVFHRTVSDSETIIRQCAKVTESGKTYAKHLSRYSVRIMSDPEQLPQTVAVSLIRDPSG